MLVTYKATHEKNQDPFNLEHQLHFFEKGEEIPLVAQGIWQIYRGLVQLSTFNQSGDEVLLGWAKTANVFGFWLHHLPTYQAIALSEVYLQWFSLSEIENSPQLAHQILMQVVQGMQQKEALLAIAGLRRVEDRLQELLQLLKQEMGQSIAEGTRIRARLTHQTLANAIGSSRVTVTKLLGEFQRQGYLTIDSDRHLVLLDS